MNMKRFALKGFCKIIAFDISNWFVYNSANVSGFEAIGYIKVSNVDVFGFFAT